MIKICCYCRREVDADNIGFGTKLERRADESTGICMSCFAKHWGALDADPVPRKKKEESAGV